MLLEIGITNIALIDKLRLKLGPGLNVLTGETGAGKSIVVDALSLALGGRADRALIRTGQDKARVEAVFDGADNNPEALSVLAELGLEPEDDLIVVSRELTQQKKGMCRVNGSVVPLGALKRLTATLVDMHGQHEHQQLSDPARHLEYLDAYGGEAHAALLSNVYACYRAYADCERALSALTMDASERERRRDMLAFQLGEIDAVAPKENEEDELKRISELNRNAERVMGGVNRAYELVYRAEKGRSAQEALRRAAESMEAISELDARFEAIKARLDELFYGAEDVGLELGDLIDSLEFDPEAADRVGARLSEIKRLTRKYGPEVSDVLAHRARVAEELIALDGGEERLDALQKQLDGLKAALAQASDALTRSRKEIAKLFTERMLGELKDLGMGRARFEVRFERRAYHANGADAVEFMLSANPGEPVKPLSSVASGGELSRIMLAMKAFSADTAGVDAMVFDEIDTGVSGRMAQVVGEKMAAIARKRQVICVTHLPQIAALADHQYLAQKTVEGERTTSSVELLDRDGRIEELARLVGGAGDAASGRAHAEHLLNAAQALIHKK